MTYISIKNAFRSDSIRTGVTSSDAYSILPPLRAPPHPPPAFLLSVTSCVPRHLIGLEKHDVLLSPPITMRCVVSYRWQYSCASAVIGDLNSST